LLDIERSTLAERLLEALVPELAAHRDAALGGAVPSAGEPGRRSGGAGAVSR
jgi:hypothetical protein